MAFQNFGKFEKKSSNFWNIRKIGREQMNEARKLKNLCFLFQGDRFEDWGDSTDDEQSKEIERLDRPHDDGSQNYHGRTGERSQYKGT